MAYGIEAEVDVCPYDENAMTLMDYRTDYLSRPDDVVRQQSSLMDRKAGREEGGRPGSRAKLMHVYVCVCWLGLWLQEVANREPTFMYAMPMGGQPGKKRVFFEETSLVARPPMTFDECKRRMELRLKHLGVKVPHSHHLLPPFTVASFMDDPSHVHVAAVCGGPLSQVLAVEEEEFCYIPMGGSLPRASQRVVAFGGAMALVHPSTGYHICRALAASGPCAAAIAQEVRRQGIGQAAQSVAGRRREVLVMVMW